MGFLSRILIVTPSCNSYPVLVQGSYVACGRCVRLVPWWDWLSSQEVPADVGALQGPSILLRARLPLLVLYQAAITSTGPP